MIQAGLVLEGGGMRGIYTAGVLDYFMEQGLQFRQVFGVSAGVCHACSFLSGQQGRALHSAIDYIKDRRYAGVHSFLTTGDFFGVDMVYNEIPNSLLPFDYDAFERSEMELYAVITNCRTGQPEYKRVSTLRDGMEVIRASSSLPLLSRKVRIGEEFYLDGGVTDSIPLAKSISEGNRKNLVILTQHRGYEKKPTRLIPIMKARYRRYPQFVRSIENRHIRYNAALSLCYREEKAGNALIIQPKEPVTIGRLEKDPDKLMALYRLGYNDARAQGQEIEKLFLAEGAAKQG